MLKQIRQILCWHIWKDVQEGSLGVMTKKTNSSKWGSYTWGLFERRLISQECVKCEKTRFVEKELRMK